MSLRALDSLVRPGAHRSRPDDTAALRDRRFLDPRQATQPEDSLRMFAAAAGRGGEYCRHERSRRHHGHASPRDDLGSGRALDIPQTCRRAPGTREGRAPRPARRPRTGRGRRRTDRRPARLRRRGGTDAGRTAATSSGTCTTRNTRSDRAEAEPFERLVIEVADPAAVASPSTPPWPSRPRPRFAAAHGRAARLRKAAPTVSGSAGPRAGPVILAGAVVLRRHLDQVHADHIAAGRRPSRIPRPRR